MSRKLRVHTIAYGETVPEVGSQFEKTDCLIIVQTEAGGNNVKLLYADGNGKVVENVPENSDSYWTKEQYEDKSHINTIGSVGINSKISEYGGEFVLDIQSDLRETEHPAPEGIGMLMPEFQPSTPGFHNLYFKFYENENEVRSFFNENPFLSKLIYEVIDESFNPTGDPDVIFEVERNHYNDRYGRIIFSPNFQFNSGGDTGISSVKLSDNIFDHNRVYNEYKPIVDKYTAENKLLKLKSFITINNDENLLNINNDFVFCNRKSITDYLRRDSHYFLVADNSLVQKYSYRDFRDLIDSIITNNIKSYLFSNEIVFTEEEKTKLKQKLGI